MIHRHIHQKRGLFQKVRDGLTMVCEHARETVVINAGVLFVFGQTSRTRTQFLFKGVSDWIVFVSIE